MAIGAHKNKLFHLGFGKSVTLSNLSKANNSRDYRIFEDFAYYMVAKAQKKLNTDVFKLGGKVYAFDSTTIDLCLSVYEWAKFRRTIRGYNDFYQLNNINSLGSYFVVRGKQNLNYRVIRWKPKAICSSSG